MTRDEFPHWEISGSKAAHRLPEAYRRHATSFIALCILSHPPYTLIFLLLREMLTLIFTVLLENTFTNEKTYLFIYQSTKTKR